MHSVIFSCFKGRRPLIEYNERTATDRETEDGDRQRMWSHRTTDDDDDDVESGQVVWGQSILYDIFFYFIDMHPRRGKCHHGLRYRCLLGGRLIGLAFDPLAHGDGWG